MFVTVRAVSCRSTFRAIRCSAPQSRTFPDKSPPAQLAMTFASGISSPMRFSTKLIRGTLVQRYKRFLADVRLADGQIVTAHCTNTGSMMGCKEPGSTVYISRSNKQSRKLAYTWEMLQINRAWVGINTMHPNRLVAEAVEAGTISELDRLPHYSSRSGYPARNTIGSLSRRQQRTLFRRGQERNASRRWCGSLPRRGKRTRHEASKGTDATKTQRPPRRRSLRHPASRLPFLPPGRRDRRRIQPLAPKSD